MKTIKDLFLRPNFTLTEVILLLLVLNSGIPWYVQIILYLVPIAFLTYYVTDRNYKVRDV